MARSALLASQVALAPLAVSLLMSCAFEAASDDDALEVGVASEALSGFGATFWQPWAGGLTTSILYCYENSLHDEATTARSIALDTLASTWSAAANIIFQDVGYCSQTSLSSSAVHIKTDNATQTQVAFFGKDLAGRSNGVTLRYYLNNKPSYCNNVSWSTCIRHQVAHEFGHVVGFAHDSERSDFQAHNCPGGIRSVLQGTPDTLITEFDPSSILETSYCRVVDNFTGLSPTDQAGVAAIYGPNTSVANCSSLPHCRGVSYDIVQPLPLYQYALRAQSGGRYLRASDTNGVDTQSFIGSWERFRLIKVSSAFSDGFVHIGDVIALQDHFRRYVSGRDDGDVNTQPERREWERWVVKSVNTSLYRDGDKLLPNMPFRLDSVDFKKHLAAVGGTNPTLVPLSTTNGTEWRFNGPLFIQ